jgi:hypothetical protein
VSRVYGETSASSEDMQRYGYVPYRSEPEHHQVWTLDLGAWGVETVELCTSQRDDHDSLVLRFGGRETLDLMRLRAADIETLREFINDALDLATRHAQANDTIELEKLKEKPNLHSPMLKAPPKRVEHDYMAARIRTNKARESGSRGGRSKFRNIQTIEQVEASIAERRRAQYEAWQAEQEQQ